MIRIMIAYENPIHQTAKLVDEIVLLVLITLA
jgi:hypothetical protein